MNPQNANGNSAGAPFGGNFDATNSGAKAAGGLSSGSFGSGSNSGSFGSGATSNGSLGAGSSAATSFARSNAIASSSRTTPAQPMPMSSGTGDIILEPETLKKSNKKKIVVAALVVVLLAGVAAALTVIKIAQNGSGGTQNIEQAKVLYNEYLNLLIDGEESSGEFDLQTFFEEDFYILAPSAMNVEQVISAKIQDNQEYIEALNTKYIEFRKAYGDELTDPIDDPIYNYYYAVGKIVLTPLDELISVYQNIGESDLKTAINAQLENNFANEEVSELYDAYHNLYENELSMVIQADQAGCLNAGTVDTTCAAAIIAEKQATSTEAFSQIYQLEYSLREQAVSELEDFYLELYPQEEVIQTERVGDE